MRKLCLSLATLLTFQAADAFGNDDNYYVDGYRVLPPTNSNPLSGNVTLWDGHYVSYEPAGPDFVAPFVIFTSDEPPAGGFDYGSLAEYQAAYDELLRDITEDAKTGGSPVTAITPEPSSAALIVMGVGGLFAARRRYRRKRFQADSLQAG